MWCVSGNEAATTNNRMELKAVVETLAFSKEKCLVIHTDSKWVENCATGLWRRKANIDLWDEYEALSRNRKIRFVWVKGHNGDVYNELVDDLARNEAKNIF